MSAVNSQISKEVSRKHVLKLSYIALRISSGYIDDWNTFLSESGTDTVNYHPSFTNLLVIIYLKK